MGDPATARARVAEILSRRGTESALVLAPMAALTHAGLRTLVDSYGGCDLLWSEMISAEALLGGTRYERYYVDESPDPQRLIVQLLGHSSEAFVDATRRLARGDAAGIDLNFGCSAPHIVRRGGGIAWMERPDAIARVVANLRPLLPDRSLSVKLRLGTDDSPEELVTLCRAVERAGADFITLHPKRRRDGSARRARWEYVAMLRAELSIPVIGNGGITDFESLGDRLGIGGDGPVMIGRAAARAPWIFSYLRGRLRGTHDEMSIDLVCAAERFFSLLERYQPPDFLSTRTRRFLPYFLSNLAFGHSLGARLGNERSYERGREAVFEYFAHHPEARVRVERR